IRSHVPSRHRAPLSFYLRSSRFTFSPFFFSTLRPPPTSTLFPYTTLFRSHSKTLREVRTAPENPKGLGVRAALCRFSRTPSGRADRKSTRLNSSHVSISYAVFCLKKKKKTYVWCCSSSTLSLRRSTLGPCR